MSQEAHTVPVSISQFFNFYFFSKLRVGVENLYEVMKEEKIPADDKLIDEVQYQHSPPPPPAYLYWTVKQRL